MKETVLIMCSGGDAPGMNACVYYLTKLLENNYKVIGVIGGFNGLISGEFLELKSEMLKPYLTLGGSFIRAGRSLEFLTENGKLLAQKNYIKYKPKCLIVLGGNGSFNGCVNIADYKIKTIAIPATIDNDLFYSDFSLGFNSAVNANVHYIKNIQACCHAQYKIPLVEVMGRDCGKLAFSTAISVSAEILAVPEVLIKEEDIIDSVKKLLIQGKKDFLILVAEKLFNTDSLAEKLTKLFKSKRQTNYELSCKPFKSSYFQRGENAVNSDIELATKFAEFTVNLIKNNSYDLAVGIKNGEVFADSILNALKIVNKFDTIYYNKLYKNK